ncbi:sigma 54-interacting response regulator [Parafilimonas terrae]|uniref:DNA-binding transcriptional response regulator, NtrC family, contains REC, AAA-type ATPase, and a Fis-type DNA-binding domains n=1 Tax=Parafilimonas terrae TaxID=1465490 RepID=A0A1I5R573_9BACT|nr:sigma 54-interacting response regulator [Parafilimonas terrae]SFP53530.1 DNA-binding transcriptional response regulator, NtrC family, contains REC, AAA-type ATPase, and a Fis-type DNA-binding domains [Parafilimonas terrae]
MKEKILIVEDQFVEADYLRLMLTQAGYNVTGIARSVTQAEEMMQEETPDFVLLDIFLKGKQTGIHLAKQLTADNIPFVYLSANSTEDILNEAKTTEPYGFLVKPFREKDLLVTLEIARYRYKHSLESKYRQEAELKKSIKNIIAKSTNLQETLLKVAATLQKYIPFDYMAAGFDNIGSASFAGTCFLRIGFNEYQTIGINELATITGKTIEELIALQSHSPQETNATVYNNDAFKNICRQPSLRKLFAETFRLKSHLEMPVFILNGRPFSFCLYSKISDAYNASHINLFENAQMLLINGIETMLNNKNNIQHKVNKIAEAGFAEGCEGIIGKSPLLLNVLDHVAQVAPSDTSVLILGESGTGKEKIADCIHNLSNRKSKPFIKVNCAALPAMLIESELFGHEKGAFTGALDKRIGKFEKANHGTILLDEIGEMPLELQVKLLRVLQEKEIERIGGRDTIKIDVRIVAATNKNLEKEVAEGRFRLDLYYRLNVFPIEMPPLRQRKEDIPVLAYHFMNYYGNKAGKKISGIADDVLKSMMAYNWRGNIRELEHQMERSVLLAKGNVIENILLPAMPGKQTQGAEEDYVKTIYENERDYIISILKKCNGRIWGAGAAAEILNIHPSTLKSKMKKLGIRKEFIQ